MNTLATGASRSVFSLDLARVAGCIGLLLLISGSFSHYVNSKLIVLSDIQATANNILTSGPLFLQGIVSGLLMQAMFIFYVLALVKLLKNVDKQLAIIMSVLAFISVPIFMLNQLNLYAILPLAQNQSIEFVGIFLDIYRKGAAVASIFFGLWLLPLGILVYKSGYLPKVIGGLLVVGSLGYPVLFVQIFLFPEIENSLYSNPFLLVTHLAEMSLMFWLLFKGTKFRT